MKKILVFILLLLLIITASCFLFDFKKSKAADSNCQVIFNSGDTTNKINIYFYEQGFNSNSELYNDYVQTVIAATFGGFAHGINLSGVAPFNSLKNEFNVFSYTDLTNTDDYGFPTQGYHSYGTIKEKLQASCEGFAAPSDWGESDGNYNIIVVPIAGKTWGSSGMSYKRINDTIVRISSSDMIYHNINTNNVMKDGELEQGINLNNIASLVHEFGHKIGFFGEEYAYYDLYLGSQSIMPNIDSSSCTKWCQGVDRESACYKKYVSWLDCFKNKFIDQSSEIQDVLTKNGINYNSSDPAWWGICLNGSNLNICGGKIAQIVDSAIRPQAYGLNSSPNEQWKSNWDYCSDTATDIFSTGGCDLGLNCGGNGCYVARSFSRFLPSKENESLMGSAYDITSALTKFNPLDESILRNNIINKTRYVDVENIDAETYTYSTPLEIPDPIITPPPTPVSAPTPTTIPMPDPSPTPTPAPAPVVKPSPIPTISPIVQFIQQESSLVTQVDTSLVDRLNGYILLQVQNAGQAWYVDPVSNLKYYLPDGSTAYNALRKFGLGITNADLEKIPVGIESRFQDTDTDKDGLADQFEESLGTNFKNSDSDGDGYSDLTEILNNFNPLGSGKLSFDSAMVNRVRGRIVLQVQSRGEAWYINPKDGKRYYMKDGGAAYQIMRFLSLGITNSDLRMISVGSL